MSSINVNRLLALVGVATLMLSAQVFADSSATSGNPQTNASDRNADVNQPNSVPGGAQKAEDMGNRGLNKVDEGVHKGIKGTKKGAKKAKKKMKEGADKMSEPANKPAY